MIQQPGNLTRTFIHGTFWSYASIYSGKILTFISTIILARLLVQEDFGVAGYALIVIGFLEIPGFGLGPALIYHDYDEGKNITAFWLMQGIGLLLLGLMWVIAPFVGEFFHDARSIPVTQVLSITLPLTALGAVHQALLQKELAFKRKFIPDLVKSLSKGLLAITLAWLGFGYWSIILGQLIGVAMATITLWLIVPWRPSLSFNPSLVRSLLSYGSSIIFTFVLGVFLLNIDYLFIGHFLGAAALGVYVIAFRIPELTVQQFCVIISSVNFPLFVKAKQNPEALSRSFLTSMSYITLITFPLALGLALVSEPFVLTFFTEKWAEAIPIMALISIYTLIRSLFFNVGDVYKAQGRPDLLAKFNLAQVAFLAPILWWVTATYGTLIAIAWTQVIVTFIIAIFYLLMTGHILKIPFTTILEAFQPAALGSVVMTLAVLPSLYLSANMLPIFQLIIGVTIGAVAYSGILWWWQREVLVKAGNALRLALVKR